MSVRLRGLARATVALLCGLLCSCWSADAAVLTRPPSSGPYVSLELMPRRAVWVSLNGEPLSERIESFGVREDGVREQVTPLEWGVDEPELASVAADGTVSIPAEQGGEFQVWAEIEGLEEEPLEAVAFIEVLLLWSEFDPRLTPAIAEAFEVAPFGPELDPPEILEPTSEADPSEAERIVVRWEGEGGPQDFFMVRLERPYIEVLFFVVGDTREVTLEGPALRALRRADPDEPAELSVELLSGESAESVASELVEFWP